MLKFTWDLQIWRGEIGKSTSNTGTLYRVKLLCEFCRWQLLTRFFLGWGTSISPYETGRYRTVLLSCDVETLYGTADTLSLWPDLIRNIRWGACRCDGLHCKDRGRTCPVGCSRCHRHFLWLHKVIFGRLVATRGFQEKINVLLQQVFSFCNAKTVFAQAIVSVTRAFASDVVVMK